VGLVVGSTAPSAIADVRRGSKLPFLIPGVGAQGGAVAASVRAGWNGDPASCLIAASRSVLFDSNPERAAATLQAEINKVVGTLQ
jgi:orotidine-5'-phosphate decarboxylase